MSADDVGGARVAFRDGGGAHRISLLIGSDPERAPRRINEWGYIREEVADGSASIFGVRTTTDGASPRDAEDHRTARGNAAEFGVLCGAIEGDHSKSCTTTVRAAGDLTYRDTPRVLDLIERVPRFNTRVVPRPADTVPGFLTALDQLMRTTAADTIRGQGRQSPVAFVYKDNVYDLRPVRTVRVPELRTPARVFRDLLRSDITIWNRKSGEAGAFSVTYGTTGPMAGVAVMARYQPRWWFRIELVLDDRVDVPPDPLDDAAIDQRVRSVCASTLAR